MLPPMASIRKGHDRWMALHRPELIEILSTGTKVPTDCAKTPARQSKRDHLGLRQCPFALDRLERSLMPSGPRLNLIVRRDTRNHGT